ncbi:hypothetical protein T11_1299 [Trichinella zimbabwensis]|uniref:Uncharacterized protein n=1 Tax=Trichinella zimbabwensis TaxID=268475 RepID=A0A0V1I3M8_9BILA|nr:hypothetical protein T11_1299 [Trichinella zimbabwensis]
MQHIYQTHRTKPSPGNKFLRWDFKVHIRSRPNRPPFDAEVSIDPLDSPIDTKGSISTTLATPGLEESVSLSVCLAQLDRRSRPH